MIIEMPFVVSNGLLLPNDKVLDLLFRINNKSMAIYRG